MDKLTKTGWELWKSMETPTISRLLGKKKLLTEDREFIRTYRAFLATDNEAIANCPKCQAIRTTEPHSVCDQHFRYHDYVLCDSPFCWRCMLGRCSIEYDGVEHPKYSF